MKYIEHIAVEWNLVAVPFWKNPIQTHRIIACDDNVLIYIWKLQKDSALSSQWDLSDVLYR